MEYVHLGGNCLPEWIETVGLTKLQASGCVSLALPITGNPVTQWLKKRNDNAEDFGSKAYEPNELHHG